VGRPGVAEVPVRFTFIDAPAATCTPLIPLPREPVNPEMVFDKRPHAAPSTAPQHAKTQLRRFQLGATIMITLATKIENLRKQTTQLSLEEAAVILGMESNLLMSLIWSGNFPIAPVARWADLRVDPQKLARDLESPPRRLTGENVGHINCP
jgi:hypothetical protein